MGRPQTKTANSEEIRLTGVQILAFEQGAVLFNQGEYFQAHEFWEKDWRRLPLPHRPQIQAAILTCGFFVLIGKGRLDPATRLANLAIERFAEAVVQAKLFTSVPGLDIPGVEEELLQMLARIRLGETDREKLLANVNRLQASVRKED